ncbi:MAG TPA: type III-A CRISPR-associated RAMP protein Csm3 [Cyanobacteria bacterium UBA11372]|nr:type III-A CRISPR-associated RAMP protein Csm3 [Cyanobacteria bacterium UBA11372]
MPASIEQKRLLGKLLINSTIVVETGLHIGGVEGNLDIGGIDKLVVRDPITSHPYIPGSSLKGKLRSILERFLNKPLNRESGGVWRYESDDLLGGFTEIKGNSGQSSQYIFYDGAATCELSRVFGSTGKDCWVKASEVQEAGETKNIVKEGRLGKEDSSGELYQKIKGQNAPARLIVRDSHLQEDSLKKLEKIDTGLFLTERKFENGIDRITAAANPRQIERVPKGARFKLEMVYTVENEEEAVKDFENLAIALAILEDDALGGNGSRGYGKVKFEDFDLRYHDYSKIAGGGHKFDSSMEKPPNNIRELLGLFDGKSSKVQQLLPGSNK